MGRRKIPAMNPDAREGEMINYAMNLAEKKLLDGTASSQLITFFLNLATTKEKLQNEKLRSDLRVAEAKIEKMQQETNVSELYEKALSAMKSYSTLSNMDRGCDYEDLF